MSGNSIKNSIKECSNWAWSHKDALLLGIHIYESWKWMHRNLILLGVGDLHSEFKWGSRSNELPKFELLWKMSFQSKRAYEKWAYGKWASIILPSKVKNAECLFVWIIPSSNNSKKRTRSQNNAKVRPKALDSILFSFVKEFHSFVSVVILPLDRQC
jgi:hypothetical protein